MKTLQTPNVFLDTQAFDASDLNVTGEKFRALQEHCREGRAKLFLTSITLGELKRHIVDRVRRAVNLLKDVRDKWWFLANLPAHELTPLFKHIDKRILIREVTSAFEAYLDTSGVTIIGLQDTNPSEVFDKYFAVSPPFGEGAKKSEFPDAFAIQALESWCGKHDQMMYVVSGDSDWKKACTDSARLLHLEGLQDFLDLVVAHQDERLRERALTDFMKHRDEIKRKVSAQFPETSFQLDEDGEVREVEVVHVVLKQPSVLATSETYATLSARAEIEFSADITLYDYESGRYDREERRWATLPQRFGTVTDEEEVEAEVRFEYSADGTLKFISCQVYSDGLVRVPTNAWERFSREEWYGP